MASYSASSRGAILSFLTLLAFGYCPITPLAQVDPTVESFEATRDWRKAVRAESRPSDALSAERLAAFERHREGRREMWQTIARSVEPRVRAQAPQGAISALPNAFATTTVFVVNAAYDDTDNNPGDGECWDGYSLDVAGTMKECSLRAAIMEANATAGHDSVIIQIDMLTVTRGATATGTFGYDAAHDVWTIPVNIDGPGNGPLPVISRSNVHIDATTQLDGSGVGTFDDAYCGNPAIGDTNVVKILVDGTLTTGANGLHILADSVSVAGLAVGGFSEVGLRTGVVDNVEVRCVHAGTDHFGKSSLPNGGVGIQISVGKHNAISRSVVSGNLDRGIELFSDSSEVSYSLIGTDRTGDYSLGNGGDGILLAGDHNVVTSSLMSGNQNGVFLIGSFNQINQAFIGVNRIGVSAIPNALAGVYVLGDSNFVGGLTPAQLSIISGNGTRGVEFSGESDGNTLVNAWVGIGFPGNVAIPNQFGVTTAGSNRIGLPPISTSPADTRPSLLSKNAVAPTFFGTVISGNSGVGVSITAGTNVVQNTRIGTSEDGATAVPNGTHGIQISGGSMHLIGGASKTHRNVISGNTWLGISMEAGTLVGIHGNYIGTNADGNAAIPNGSGGVSTAATFTIIGGSLATGGAGNLISGNDGPGINSLDPNVTILGNLIGTNAGGTAAIPNAGAGVVLIGPTSAIVGGPLSGNLISGNTGNGIEILDPGGASNERPVAAKGASVLNVIQANRIGTRANGTSPLPNGGHGVSNQSSIMFEIGGNASQYANRIGYNGGDGIRVTGTGITTISRNYIFSNVGLGIDLDGDGVTLNDAEFPYDLDVGPNGLLNFPNVFSAVVAAPETLSISYNYSSHPFMPVRFEFFVSPFRDPTGHGEGLLWAATRTDTTDANGEVNFTGEIPGSAFQTGLYVTATATSLVDLATSEFGLAKQIDGSALVLSNAKVFLEGPYQGSGIMSPALANAGYRPLNQPYGDPLFDGTPAEYDSLVSAEAFGVNLVDWLTLSLRSGTTGDTEVARRVALVHTLGTISEINGVTDVMFYDVPFDDYYLVVCHRNHLCAMSSSPVDFTTSGGVGTWDFTTGLGQAYSSGGDGLKQLGGGVYGLFAADANADGFVTAPDFNVWNVQTSSGTTGYVQGDYNMDGFVTAPDFNNWNGNTSAGAASQVPD